MPRWCQTPCVGDQIVALSPCTSATAQELPDRPVHLVRMIVRGLHHRRGFRKFLFHVPGIDQQGVARGLLIAKVIVEVRMIRQTRARESR